MLLSGAVSGAEEEPDHLSESALEDIYTHNDTDTTDDHDVASDDDEGEGLLLGPSDVMINSTNSNFLKPLHLLSQLSGFPNLLMLYSIFSSLAVSSASAERALSKLKIVKNRLRSSLCDDMLSSLMLLACEKDLMHDITTVDIINRMSHSTPSLRAHLLH